MNQYTIQKKLKDDDYVRFVEHINKCTGQKFTIDEALDADFTDLVTFNDGIKQQHNYIAIVDQRVSDEHRVFYGFYDGHNGKDVISQIISYWKDFLHEYSDEMEENYGIDKNKIKIYIAFQLVDIFINIKECIESCEDVNEQDVGSVVVDEYAESEHYISVHGTNADIY